MDQFSAISDAMRRLLVSSILGGYASADDNYNEPTGSNAHTYGTDIYHMTWKRLAGSAELAELGVEFKEVIGRKRLLLAKDVIACHRLGAFVPPNLAQAAPAVSLRRARQLGLPFAGAGEDYTFDPTCTMVIAHYGNPEDGCLGVHLQVPATGDARDGPWAAAQCLWLPGDEIACGDGGPRSVPGVAAELIEPPVVRRRRKEQA